MSKADLAIWQALVRQLESLSRELDRTIEAAKRLEACLLGKTN